MSNSLLFYRKKTWPNAAVTLVADRGQGTQPGFPPKDIAIKTAGKVTPSRLT